MLKRLFLAAVLISFSVVVLAEEPKIIKLPQPQLDVHKTLAHALKERKSTREFSTKKLPVNVLSNLLWSACGVNRPETGKRTAPSAMNSQEIDVYAATSDGLYLYDVKEHALRLVLARDIRPDTGKQPFVSVAPVNLIYVADFSKMGGATAEERIFYSAADTGFISQNVYLFCASEGLATVVRGSMDKDELAKTMNLRPGQKVILAQTVGYPKE